MSSGDMRLDLFGRRAECEALDAVLHSARTGQSRVLVLRGEPGVGKTALLDYVARSAEGCIVARAAGVESEMELAFSGVHQLCAAMLASAEQLPRLQRDALWVAFGRSEGVAPDRFLVGLALLSLLSEVADAQPLICLVDDAQWLDRESLQCLAFVARRLLAEPIALVLALREPLTVQEFAGLPELVLSGLGDQDARRLLASAIQGRMDEQVQERLVADSRGNPLALLEWHRWIAPADLAGGFGLPDAGRLESRLERGFYRRLQVLPPETQQLLLAAAAEPVGDVAILWRAAERLGISQTAAAPAIASGLIDFGTRVRFRHPLVRSAVYRAASVAERQRVHRALADATDLDLDPDRRAWHLAHAATGPDEGVASELERSADRARGRGGVAAAAAFLARAAELTPDPARRGIRALAAAEAKLHAAAPDGASELLAAAEMCPLEELDRARLELIRARIEFTRTRGGEAPMMLVEAARRLESLDVNLARETYLEALGAAIFAGRLTSGGGVLEVAEAGRAAARTEEQPRGLDLLLDGLATRFSGGSAEAAPLLHRALQAFVGEGALGEHDAHWLWLACRIAPDVWDDEAWDVLTALQVRLARSAGALAVLPVALTFRAGLEVLSGAFTSALALIEEADTITRATGNAPFTYGSLVVTAWRGRGARALDTIAVGLHEATRRGEGRAVTLAAYATAVLSNALGDYTTALDAATRACEQDDLDLCGWALVELVEAADRIGRQELATGAVRRLEERTRGSGTDWALATSARARALISDGEAADALYQEALERLARTRIAVDRARTHLLYGEWLRRQGRRRDAREQLRAAHEMFTTMGAAAFAERARRELIATGETVRKRSSQTSSELTAQESQVAWLARDGYTNPEIAAELFISPRTVEWHLRKVFRKLGISSRRELRKELPDRRPENRET
jgi:DNA-binding CsgD family transcriptional regulator